MIYMHINISNLYGLKARKSATHPIYARHFIMKTTRRRVASAAREPLEGKSPAVETSTCGSKRK